MACNLSPQDITLLHSIIREAYARRNPATAETVSLLDVLKAYDFVMRVQGKVAGHDSVYYRLLVKLSKDESTQDWWERFGSFRKVSCVVGTCGQPVCHVCCLPLIGISVVNPKRWQDRITAGNCCLRRSSCGVCFTSDLRNTATVPRHSCGPRCASHVCKVLSLVEPTLHWQAEASHIGCLRHRSQPTTCPQEYVRRGRMPVRWPTRWFTL
jgi:hypothetical protein